MDTGSSAFILICSAMVCLMTPALASSMVGLDVVRMLSIP